MADGSIVVNINLDDKQAQQKLDRLTKTVDDLNDKINLTQRKKLALTEDAEKLTTRLDAAKAKLEQMRTAASGVYLPEDISAQSDYVNKLQGQWDKVQNTLDGYDNTIKQSTIEMEWAKEEAGGLAQQLGKAGRNSEKMKQATEKANKSLRRFSTRLRSIIMGAFVFNLLSSAFRDLTEWVGKAIKNSDEAKESISRLKGALLTLAQPLIESIIPAFTAFVDVLTAMAEKAANLIAVLFGTTVEDASKSAEAFYEEQKAIEGIEKGAKKAAKSLAGFDQINKLSGETSTSNTIEPTFPTGGNTSWLSNALGDVAGKVTAALMLGGIAFIAFGAGLGNLGLILSGMSLLGAGIMVGTEGGGFKSWAEALGLNNVFDYVTAAMQLAGIALIAIGARMNSIAMVVAGGVLLGLGVSADAIGEETLKSWWEVLKLTNVQQWVGAALLLVGIALIAIGACMGNIMMILAGAGMLALGTITSASEGNLKNWVTTLGLEKVVGWVTAALLLVGIALVVFGIFTGNIMMILAGAGMLGAGISIGITSGTFANWLNTISMAFVGFKEKILNVFDQLWNGMRKVINSILGGVEWMANKVINGINAVIDAMNRIQFKIPDWLGGGSFGFNIRKLNTVNIPRLAEGSVVPPNREFLAVLGDNKTETEVVSPLSTMKQAMIEAMRESGGGTYTFVVNLDGKEVARNQVKHINDMTRQAGKPVLLF